MTIGCGGKTSAPGQPGTTPPAPRVPSSSAELSATTMSAPPWVQSTGGFSASDGSHDQSQYFGDRALSRPRVPGAAPGQFSDGTASPG